MAAAPNFSYDKTGNLTEVVYSDQRKVSFTYNDAGQMVSAADWDGTAKYQYDAKGQVTEAIDGNSQVIRYTWTKTGQKKPMLYPNGNKVEYGYDQAGNLTQVKSGQEVTAYQYDSLGRMTEKLLPNGIKHKYTYDNAGQLAWQEETGPGGSSEAARYAYDKKGDWRNQGEGSSGKLKPVSKKCQKKYSEADGFDPL